VEPLKIWNLEVDMTVAFGWFVNAARTDEVGGSYVRWCYNFVIANRLID
jgi:hypothetical protein